MLFSGNDQDILKVLKMNQDNCKSALDQAKAFNAEADAGISDTEGFIAGIEKKHGTGLSAAVSKQINMPPKPIVRGIETSDWHELVEEARPAYPDRASIDDILTLEEYQNAMRHLDSIDNDEFSRQTELKKVD